jgi:hypothetical protein
LIGGVPFIEPTPSGRIAVSVLNVLVFAATVAAVGRTVLSLLPALLLAGAALTFHFLGVSSGAPERVELSWVFGSVPYAAMIVYLLRYVFQRDVMTSDKRFGAVAGWLMLGVLGAHVHASVRYFQPGAFARAGTVASVEMIDLVCFSFTVPTSTGFGDIVPVLRQSRARCVVEQTAGVVRFLAILIARLAGVYPPNARGGLIVPRPAMR